MALTTTDLSCYLDAAKEAARLASTVLHEWRERFSVRAKGRFDLVTEADLASEQAIREYLGGRFPGHAFLCEEDRSSQNRPGIDAPPTWIIDPLDGTTNYVHGYPFYCVSIGLQIAGELVVGVILDPSRNELFSAARGTGAWLNDRRLSCSKTARLEEALLVTGFPADMRGREKLLEWWRYFGERVHGLRRTGSTALNLAYLAAGYFDGFWAFDSHVWDVAAGTVLIREAGGVVGNVDGTTFDPYTPDALAATAPLYATLLECFRAGHGR
jgi:myo-inositol-1(or 4)-monophosphatase